MSPSSTCPQSPSARSLRFASCRTAAQSQKYSRACSCSWRRRRVPADGVLCKLCGVISAKEDGKAHSTCFHPWRAPMLWSNVCNFVGSSIDCCVRRTLILFIDLFCPRCQHTWEDFSAENKAVSGFPVDFKSSLTDLMISSEHENDAMCNKDPGKFSCNHRLLWNA